MVVSSSSEKKRVRLEALGKKLSGTQPSEASRLSWPASSPVRPPVTRFHDTHGNDAPYAGLCPSVVKGPFCADFALCQVSDTGAAVNDLLTEILQTNTKFSGDVGGTIESRMQDTVLLLDSRATQGGATERARQRARLERSKRSNKHLSASQHRKLGSYDLPGDFQKHTLYQPLHAMWEGYAKDLINNCSDTMIYSRLLTADLHGAILVVVDCSNSTFIGVQGIMVRETEKTFGLVTAQDKFRVIPKTGTTFRLEVNNIQVTLFGDGLALRGAASSSRSRKVKSSGLL